MRRLRTEYEDGKMIFETNTQKSDITSAGGDGSGERADRRDQPVVYFVLPCYNEAEGLVHTADVLAAKVAHLTETGRISKQSRILFVDDGSKDGTVREVKKLIEQDPRVHIISFSRNFGKEAAMFAGLEKSRGDYVVMMDVDLQDPPSLLPEMFEYIWQGYDSVATRRVTRKGEPPIRSFFARRFYHLMK